MTELTPTAESRLNAYLHELRRVLSGSPSVDPADVERDVRDHIDAALVGQAPPIDDSALNHVLQTLGSPGQWLPETEAARAPAAPAFSLSAMKQRGVRYLRRLAGGPESFRLAHWSLIVFAVGWALTLLSHHPGPLCVAVPVSFLLSRAALSLFTVEEQNGGQKWLLYPVLAVAYLLLLLVLVVAPIVVGVAAWEHRIHQTRPQSLTQAEVVVAVSACSGGTWLMLGVVTALFPAAVRNVFHPFAPWYSRRSGLRLAMVGLAVLFIVGAYLWFHGLLSST